MTSPSNTVSSGSVSVGRAPDIDAGKRSAQPSSSLTEDLIGAKQSMSSSRSDPLASAAALAASQAPGDLQTRSLAVHIGEAHAQRHAAIDGISMLARERGKVVAVLSEITSRAKLPDGNEAQDYTAFLQAYEANDSWAKMTIGHLATYGCMAQAMISEARSAPESDLNLSAHSREEIVQAVEAFASETFHNLAYCENKFCLGAAKHNKRTGLHGYSHRTAAANKGRKFYLLNAKNSDAFASKFQGLLGLLKPAAEPWYRAAYRIMLDHYVVPKVAEVKGCTVEEAARTYFDMASAEHAYFDRTESAWNAFSEKFSGYAIEMTHPFDQVKNNGAKGPPRTDSAGNQEIEDKATFSSAGIEVDHLNIFMDGKLLGDSLAGHEKDQAKRAEPEVARSISTGTPPRRRRDSAISAFGPVVALDGNSDSAAGSAEALLKRRKTEHGIGGQPDILSRNQSSEVAV